jgi:hypothetical protein
MQTQKLKFMEEDSQSTYTLQHPHSQEKRKHGNKWLEAQIKPLPISELETSDFDTMLEWMH